MNASANQTPRSTGQIPATERLGLRTMEARIEWWATAAREAVAVSAPERTVAA